MNEETIYPKMVIRSQAETINLLEQELDQYKNNWEELKKWLNKYFVGTMSDAVLNKMKELEEDK